MRGQLTVEASKYQLLRQRLLADYPNLEEETVADTLEGITDLHEMIAVVIRSALVVKQCKPASVSASMT
jgi:hypothetical protein